MWYVVWTTTGSELKLCSWISEYVSDITYDDCFCPQVEQVMKIEGEWNTFCKTLFPGYVVVSTDQQRVKLFEEQLNRYDGFAVILSNEGIISPIDSSETFYIESAYANKGILGCSTGIIENDKVRILSGPLKGREGEIKHINRHKRTAVLELDMFSRVSRVSLGLDVLSKN